MDGVHHIMNNRLLSLNVAVMILIAIGMLVLALMSDAQCETDSECAALCSTDECRSNILD
jgi:hypothetical protein